MRRFRRDYDQQNFAFDLARLYAAGDLALEDVWIHDFKKIYAQILEHVDLPGCLAACGRRLMTEMGFDPAELPLDMAFADYLSVQGLMDALTKRELRQQLGKLFLQNPLIDNNFGLACSLLTDGLLGHPLLKDHNRDQLLLWLWGIRPRPCPPCGGWGYPPQRPTYAPLPGGSLKAGGASGACGNCG